MVNVTRVLTCLVLVFASACDTGVSPENAGVSEGLTVTVEPPVYLEEMIPPCVPPADTDADPCALGPREPLPASDDSENDTVAATPMPIDEVTLIKDVMLGKAFAYSDLLPSLITHIVIRGTVLVGTTRCNDYYMKLATYYTNRINEGLIRVHCFVDVRVNEYLVGEGPPVLPVSLYVNVTTFSDREGYMDREDTIDFYGGEDVWIANLFDDPAEWVAQTYEGREMVLFLGLPFAITLEAFVARNPFGRWFVQRDEDGTIRAVAESSTKIRDPVKRAEGNIPLAELERRIAAAAINRNAVTGGRIGTDPSLPLLVSDANDLRTHYKAIGAVYVTDESVAGDVQHPTFGPPPAPGADQPVSPPARTGENGSDDEQTPPVPGEDPPPSSSIPEDAPTTTMKDG